MALNNIMTVFFATLTAISICTSIDVKSDGEIASLLGSDDGYTNL